MPEQTEEAAMYESGQVDALRRRIADLEGELRARDTLLREIRRFDAKTLERAQALLDERRPPRQRGFSGNLAPFPGPYAAHTPLVAS